MTEITRKLEMDIGHRVPNHKSKCRNIHGHRYVLEVTVSGDLVEEKGASSEGMVMDFSDLKEIMTRSVHDVFDHGFIMFEDDPLASDFKRWQDGLGMKIIFVPFIPTAENLASYWMDILSKALADSGITVIGVKVVETPNSWATCSNQK